MSNAEHKAQASAKPLTPPPGHKASEAPVAAAPAAPGAKPAKAPKPPKEPKAPRESNFKRVYPDSAVITVLTPEGKNPKRVGCKAYAIFDLYKDNKTVGDFIKSGGRYSALAWDTGHGFIKVS